MPYDTVRKFEQEMAEYCGSRYAVSVSSCTNAIFLCLMYYKTTIDMPITLPKHTYVGVACAVKNAGYEIEWSDERWDGAYMLYPTKIVDSALRLYEGMYDKLYQDAYVCLSFHSRKHIGIGRGGMILTDDKEAAQWLRRARFDGRDECEQLKDNFTMTGWNMYMTPEQAARGLTLLHFYKETENHPDIDDYDTYPDLSKVQVFNEADIFDEGF